MKAEDSERSHRSAEAIVNIHHSKTGCTASKHAVKRCTPTCTDPIPNRHRDADHGLRNQSRQNRRQSPLHPGAGNQHIKRLKTWQLFEQPMQAGDADIKHQLGSSAMAMQGQLRFRGNPEITGTTTKHHHRTNLWARLRERSKGEAMGGLMPVKKLGKAVRTQTGLHGRSLLSIHPGHKRGLSTL